MLLVSTRRIPPQHDAPDAPSHGSDVLERIASALERIADAAEAGAEQLRTGSKLPRRRRRASNDNVPAEQPATVPMSEIDRRRAVALAKRLGFIVPGGEGA